MTVPRIRAGMVGLGMIFDETYWPFFEAVRRDGLYQRSTGLVEVEFAAAATRTGVRGEKLKNNFPDFVNCSGADGVGDLLKQNVDVVCIATPDDRHFAPAKAALLAGKHVLIEKPSVLALKELDELIRIAAENRVLAKVVYHKLLDPDHKKLRTLVADGVLQHVNNGYCSLLEPKSIALGQFSEWLGGRNPATYVAVHYLKLIDFTFGPDWTLITVMATGQRGITAAWDSVQMRVIYRHPDSREAAFDIHTSWVTPDNFPGYVEQEVQFRFDNAVWNAHQRKRGVEVCVEPPHSLKNTPNHHYNGTFLEPWGDRSQRGYGIEVIQRFFEEVAYVENGHAGTRDERLSKMRALRYNDLSADRNVIAAVQAVEAILKSHSQGEPNRVITMDYMGARDIILKTEPVAQRTYTPTLAVIAKNAGVFHWTVEGRRLFDYTSGVLVANLGHQPTSWVGRFAGSMGWDCPSDGPFQKAVPLTAYNAITPIEAEATQHLIEFCQKHQGGSRLQKVLWAASGAEAIQKALWAAMAFDRTRPMILATRFGFHGKKGLSGAVTGSEIDSERDPRVRFISFPMQECLDISSRDSKFDPAPYRKELDDLWHQFGAKIGTLITEPYLGGAGSYHPPTAYLQLLQSFCREKNILFILDEVEANFGRTGKMFAYETYGLQPDLVMLGKGLGNGIPVAATIGRAYVLDSLNYGEASDTWRANPLSCAAVQATLDEFESRDVLGPIREVSAVIEAELVKLKEFPVVKHIRGEKGGMVWGVEFESAEIANAFVLEAYQGDGSNGVHLLGPLAKKVVRISPPLVITKDEALQAGELLHAACARVTARFGVPGRSS